MDGLHRHENPMIFRASDALSEIAPFVDGGGVDPRCDPGRRQAFAALNRATRQLMNEGDWQGMASTICLPVRACGTIVLDERFETVRLAKWRTGSPIPIYSEGFKFLEGGLDPEASRIPSLVDLGESAPLHVPLPRAMALMAYSEHVEEDGATLEIRGIDESGRDALTVLPVRHSWRSASPPAYTGQDCDRWLSGRWASVSELRKPVTRGLVHVFGYDPATLESVWLTTLRPETISPTHRLYRVPGGGPGQIIARVVLRWHPLHFESDVLPVQNIDAIARMVQALHALDTGNAGLYEFYRNGALSQLRKQMSKRERPARTGLQVSMSRGPSRIGRGSRGRFFPFSPSCPSPGCSEGDEDAETETTVLNTCVSPCEGKAPKGTTDL